MHRAARRTARALGWKPYMVFQRATMLAIDREEPGDLEALDGGTRVGVSGNCAVQADPAASAARGDVNAHADRAVRLTRSAAWTRAVIRQRCYARSHSFSK